MKEKIAALVENPQKFMIAALQNPEEGIIFLKNIPSEDYLKIEKNINELILFFNTLDGQAKEHTLQEKFCLLIIASNLMVYFHTTEKPNHLGTDKESYYAEKMDIYHEALSQIDTDILEQARLSNFMGYIQNLTNGFSSAIHHYQEAINFEQKALTEHMDLCLREYFIGLSSAHLKLADNAYKRPAPGLAKKNYQDAINTINKSFEQSINYKQNILYFLLAQSNGGLAKLARDASSYQESIDLYIESISASISGLKIGMSSLVQKEMFLDQIKNCASSIKHILAQKKTFSTVNQEKLMNESTLFVRNYLASHYSESEFIKLRKIMDIAEKRMPFQQSNLVALNFLEPQPKGEKNSHEENGNEKENSTSRPVNF